VKKIFLEIEVIRLLYKEIKCINEGIKSKLDATLEAMPKQNSNPKPDSKLDLLSGLEVHLEEKLKSVPKSNLKLMLR